MPVVKGFRRFHSNIVSSRQGFPTAFLMPIVKGFRRFHSNIVSSRQVVTEISNLVSGSNVSTAPLTSNRPIRKRVNSADRREMLESFVNKYIAMNLGKFPSPTRAQKEVGGSYYSIKKMLQEMEYNFKMTPVEKGPTKENKKQVKGDDAVSAEVAIESSGSHEKSNSQITIDPNICQDPWLESGSNFNKSTDTGNNNIAIDDTHIIATESDGKPEQNPRDDNLAFKDSESKVAIQSDRIRNMRDKEEKDNELREKSSLWGNLKSLANEFMNMWKK